MQRKPISSSSSEESLELPDSSGSDISSSNNQTDDPIASVSNQFCAQCEEVLLDDQQDHVGCNHCNRWLHIACLTGYLRFLSFKQLKSVDLKCQFCKEKV